MFLVFGKISWEARGGSCNKLAENGLSLKGSGKCFLSGNDSFRVI
jgi:hypothetical protein